MKPQFILMCAALLCAHTSAHAHHPSHVSRDSTEKSVIAAQLSVDHAKFDILSRRGTWTRMTLEALYAPISWLHFELTLPIAWVREEGREESFGISDMELGLRARPYTSASGQWVLEAGLKVEVPTGDVHEGLGGGHVALIPSLALKARATDTLRFHTSLYLASSIGSHAHAPGSWHSMLAIHSLHELGIEAGAEHVDKGYRTGLAIKTIQGLSGEELAGPSSVIFRAGVPLGQGWALKGEFELPFAGERRTDWRASLGVGWRLSLEDVEDCGCDEGECEGSPECECE